MTLAARLWERLLSPIFDFAGERYRETQESIALGGREPGPRASRQCFRA
jgi:hypothetical protein